MPRSPKQERPKSVRQLREQVERKRLLAESAFYDEMDGRNSLYDLGWDGPGAWKVGQTFGELAGDGTRDVCWGFVDERSHQQHIAECRALAYRNCFARNAINNLRFYVKGTGFTYKVTARDTASAVDKKLAEKVQADVDEAVERLGLAAIESELVTRCERDGEIFVVAYANDSNEYELRIREPSEVYNPTRRSEERGVSRFGIDFDKDDAAKVLGYWVAGNYADAEDVRHLRINVDSNVPRGISSLWVPREAFTDAAKALRSVTRTAIIQSSVPFIRYHDASGAVVSNMLAGSVDRTRTTEGGKTASQKDWKIGSAIDASAKTKYEFPTTAVDVVKMTEAIQANLRAAGSALTMPEWMLTGKLDAKFANAEVSEGPTGMMFAEKQVMYTAFMRGLLMDFGLDGYKPEELSRVTIAVIAPGTGQGQTLEEAQVSEVQARNGVISKSTWAAKAGYDFAREQQEIAKEEDAALGITPGANNGANPPA
ncbi:MAG: hypothetical protein JSS51_04475 [Planctomycetes bacterium]|nr:hypothetical protein [Planctomycetota bacterium]